MDNMFELTVGGGVALLILREVFSFISSFRNKNNRIPCSAKSFSAMEKQIDTLFQMHDQRDANGVPLWYFSSSAQDELKDINVQLKDLNNIIKHYGAQFELVIQKVLSSVGG